MEIKMKPFDDVATNAIGFDELKRSIENERCIAVIGAGVSAPDFPLWAPLMGRLLTACSIRPEDLPLSSVNDLMLQAEHLRLNHRQKYYEVLNDIFTNSSVSATTQERYHLLVRINFCSYINLNFDQCLINTMNLHENIHVSIYPNLSPQFLQRREIYHLHGQICQDRRAEDGAIVLTKDEFDHAYQPHSRLHSLLNTAFNDHDICFLGCNPAEPNFNRLLRACKNLQDQVHGLTDFNRPRRFLIWDDESSLPDLNGTGIHAIDYSRKNATF
ncbi:MAG: SIR2 family protein, partial [Aureliella sp.]